MPIPNFSPIILTSDSPVPFIPSLLTVPAIPTVPIITTTNPLVSFPIHPSLDLNRDPNLHQMMTKYFYYKTLDKWLKKEKDMLELLNYLKVTDKGIEVVEPEKNNSQYDNQLVVDKKVDFIENNVLSKDDIYNILKKYVRETNTNWYDLEEKATYFIKEIIKKFIKKKFESALQRSNKRL